MINEFSGSRIAQLFLYLTRIASSTTGLDQKALAEVIKKTTARLTPAYEGFKKNEAKQIQSEIDNYSLTLTLKATSSMLWSLARLYQNYVPSANQTSYDANKLSGNSLYRESPLPRATSPEEIELAKSIVRLGEVLVNGLAVKIQIWSLRNDEQLTPLELDIRALPNIIWALSILNVKGSKDLAKAIVQYIANAEEDRRLISKKLVLTPQDVLALGRSGCNALGPSAATNVLQALARLEVPIDEKLLEVLESLLEENLDFLPCDQVVILQWSQLWLTTHVYDRLPRRSGHFQGSELGPM